MANARLTQASLDRVQETLDGALALERAGLGGNYDVLRLQVELARLEPNLRRAQTDRTEAERRLKIAMGMHLTESLTFPAELGMIDLDRPESNSPVAQSLLQMAGVQVSDSSQVPELVAVALANRSDARQARLDTELWRAQLSAARATLYPKLFGFANYTIDAQENGSPDFFGENSSQRVTNWQAGLRLEVPLLEGGQKFARMAQRSLQVEQSLTREELIEQQVTGTVETLVERLLEARARARAQGLALQQAQRGFEIALTEFEQGLNSQLNALDAEVALRETQFNYAEAIYDVLRTQADLDAAVGVVPVIDVSEEAR